MRMFTDFHSHILPGVDDGSRSVEQSLTMLRMEKDQGIGRVVATPHFYPQRDNPEAFFERRERAAQVLLQETAKQKDLPEILMGAEVYYFPGISDCEILPQMTLAGTKSLLLEMPATAWTEKMYREIGQIYEKWEITPVLAHINRYIRPRNAAKILDRLGEMPVLLQANADFFLRRSTSRMALRLWRDGKIHLLGSDCHDDVQRPPNLGEALRQVEKHLGEDAIERIHTYEKMIFRPSENLF